MNVNETVAWGELKTSTLVTDAGTLQAFCGWGTLGGGSQASVWLSWTADSVVRGVREDYSSAFGLGPEITALLDGGSFVLADTISEDPSSPGIDDRAWGMVTGTGTTAGGSVGSLHASAKISFDNNPGSPGYVQRWVCHIAVQVITTP